MRTALWCLYAVFWLGGIVTGGLAPNASWAAPAFLILAGILAFRKELIPAVLIGFTAELIGVRTGYPSAATSTPTRSDPKSPESPSPSPPPGSSSPVSPQSPAAATACWLLSSCSLPTS